MPARPDRDRVLRRATAGCAACSRASKSAGRAGRFARARSGIEPPLQDHAAAHLADRRGHRAAVRRLRGRRVSFRHPADRAEDRRRPAEQRGRPRGAGDRRAVRARPHRYPPATSRSSTGGPPEAAAAIDNGKADLAVVRRDAGMPKNGQVIAILRKNVVVFIVPSAPEPASRPSARRARPPQRPSRRRRSKRSSRWSASASASSAARRETSNC